MNFDSKKKSVLENSFDEAIKAIGKLSVKTYLNFLLRIPKIEPVHM